MCTPILVKGEKLTHFASTCYTVLHTQQSTHEVITTSEKKLDTEGQKL